MPKRHINDDILIDLLPLRIFIASGGSASVEYQ
jgi:hypothetical protein